VELEIWEYIAIEAMITISHHLYERIKPSMEGIEQD
jgi:hypothetical protein